MNERTVKRSRLARGTEQGLSASEAVHGAPDDMALDEALRRGIAMLCVEQAENSFFANQLAKSV